MNKHFGKHLTLATLALGITATLFSHGVYAAAQTSAQPVPVSSKAVVVKGAIKSVPASEGPYATVVSDQLVATVVATPASPSGKAVLAAPDTLLIKGDSGEIQVILANGKTVKAIPAVPCTKATKVIKK